jgi:hypothetical protein
MNFDAPSISAMALANEDPVSVSQAVIWRTRCRREASHASASGPTAPAALIAAKMIWFLVA